jgi:hypothetical protein
MPKRQVMANGSHGLLKSTVSLASAKLTIVISAIVPTRHQTSVARVGDIDTLPDSNAGSYGADMLKILFRNALSFGSKPLI